MNRLIVNADQGECTINPNVYGHFSEHLGRCIYGSPRNLESNQSSMQGAAPCQA